MLISAKRLNDKERKIINNKVGARFNLFKRMTSDLIKSRSFVVEQLSPKIGTLLGGQELKVQATIELRTKGIIMTLKSSTAQCIWIVPYYQFYLYDRQVISIHAQGRFVNLTKDDKLAESMDFFKNLISKKIEYDILHPHIDSI
ncbi:hypothetical protein [Aquimarina intermedia]|uniref:Uncharacterized protein n=1 Tax=Aquimarina intermedia TaxID=350814 RepID=A0A5S5C4H1_9FLAO|nr:hypothetical protein [Aquimarina intermedia]TYP74234.1 hypothetical protein BD809_10452 [Aquimarina intermedia]